MLCLHAMVSDPESDNAISWNNDGTALVIHNRDLLENEVLKTWFETTRYRSLQRQLNMYGFEP